MTLTPGPKEFEFNNWYETKFKPAMERGPLDKYVARQAWFAATAPLLARIAELERHNKALVERSEFDVRDIVESTNKLVELEHRCEALTAQVEHLKATASANYGRGHADAHSMQVEQAAQPVAWHTEDHLTDRSATTYDKNMMYRWQCKGWPITPLYTAPPKAVPLTEDVLKKMHHEDQFGLFCDYDDFEQIARAVEQAHGITPATVEKG